jgi:hypothetical protein
MQQLENTPLAPAIMTELAQLVPLLIRNANIKEGWYTLATTFQITVANNLQSVAAQASDALPQSEPSSPPIPGAFCQVVQVGIQQMSPNSPFAIDASTVWDQ